MPTLSSSQPTVSIGLPVYNGAKYIKEALDSLLCQSFQDFEIIISDNASDDNTETIARSYEQRDDRITYIKQTTNIGSANNFLYVLHKAKGKYFMWAAHDDMWAENWLEVLIKELSPSDIGVRGKIVFFQDKLTLKEKSPPNYKKNDLIKCFLGNETNYRNHYIYSLFVREKLLKSDFRSFQLEYCPDQIFIFSLLQIGSLRTSKDTKHFYRVHNDNFGKTLSKKWKGWKKIVYRIHPLMYYTLYLDYTTDKKTRLAILLLIPIKHIYAQTIFWLRCFRQIITRKTVI
jgi:glycosyltransferase involved in cell wall biosynthesis